MTTPTPAVTVPPTGKPSLIPYINSPEFSFTGTNALAVGLKYIMLYVGAVDSPVPPLLNPIDPLNASGFRLVI